MANFSRLDSVGIREAVEGDAFSVVLSPNPADESSCIRVSGVEGEIDITIVDMHGRRVYNSTWECNGDCEQQLNIANLVSGSYFVRLQGNGLNTVKKLVVK